MKTLMTTIQMLSIGIGIVPSLVPLALIQNVLGVQLDLALFVNGPKSCDRRGPNTRLYISRKNPGFNLYNNDHTLCVSTERITT